MSPSPLGSEVLPPGPPTRRCRLQVRRCDSRRSGVELEPFVSPRSVGLAGGPFRSSRRPGERSPPGPSPVARAGPGAGPRVSERRGTARGSNAPAVAPDAFQVPAAGTAGPPQLPARPRAPGAHLRSLHPGRARSSGLHRELRAREGGAAAKASGRWSPLAEDSGSRRAVGGGWRARAGDAGVRW